MLVTRDSRQTSVGHYLSSPSCPFSLSVTSDHGGVISLDLPEQDFIPDHGTLAAHLPTLLAGLSGLTRSPSRYGTPFQEAVWQAIAQIPLGETCTYQELSRSIGMPSAVRAVANACGANRLALWIPCHRVVRTDGTLGGYRWGLKWKSSLLAAESALLPLHRTESRVISIA